MTRATQRIFREAAIDRLSSPDQLDQLPVADRLVPEALTVEVRDKKVYINGTPLDEPYAHYLDAAGPSELREVTSSDVRDHFGPVTVPPDDTTSRPPLSTTTPLLVWPAETVSV